MSLHSFSPILEADLPFQRDGIGSPDEWTYRLEGMRWMLLQGPGARQWWRLVLEVHPEPFREVVDSLIREIKAPT
jgi:hypothetical protein